MTDNVCRQRVQKPIGKAIVNVDTYNPCIVKYIAKTVIVAVLDIVFSVNVI